MPKINVLPENLANKIAAGEVIERPAAVVKELIENALDAKARAISIFLTDGGTRKIGVQDDGEGMSREDALLAFERHATSKIINETDLFTIATFGFRGEALPSIASVSNVRLVTKTAEDEEGSEIVLNAGVLKESRGIGAPTGSLFEVCDLFYNVPARKKFLKSVSTELSHIRQVVFQQALAHPEIHFQLTHQDRTLLTAPAVLSFRDRVSTLYGDETLTACIEGHTVFPEANIHFFISRVPLHKSSPKDPVLFVNRRVIKSPIIARAIYDAYGTLIMKGDYPFYLLYLDIDPTQIDVNVHPTKREIRFQNGDRIYQAVKNGIREALTRRGGEEPARMGNDIPDPLPQKVSILSPVIKEGTYGGAPLQSAPPFTDRTRQETYRGIQKSRVDAIQQSAPRGTPLQFPERLIRPMGQVYGTFLLAEVDGELVMVDQHTAHERILYEAFLKNRSQTIETQPLLIPRQVDLKPTQAAWVTDHIGLLQEAGFMLEPFGETLFLIRAVPVGLSAMDIESFLTDLADDFVASEMATDQPQNRVFASMACHSAVRAHQPLNHEQIHGLLHDYFSRDTPPTCPHGRPILMTYPLPDLEKLFRRK